MKLPTIEEAVGRDIAGRPSAAEVCEFFERTLKGLGLTVKHDPHGLEFWLPAFAFTDKPALQLLSGINGGRLDFVETGREVTIRGSARVRVRPVFAVALILAAILALLFPGGWGIAALFIPAALIQWLGGQRRLRRFIRDTADEVADTFAFLSAPPPD